MSYIATAEDFRAKSEKIVGLPIRVVYAEAPPEQNGLIAVAVTFDAPARRRVKADGTLVKVLPSDPRYQRTVYVKRVAAGWVLRAVVRD